MTTLLEEKGIIKGVMYKNKAGEEMRSYAPLTIVCDGCFSNLRRNLCTSKVMIQIQAFVANIRLNFSTGGVCSFMRPT